MSIEHLDHQLAIRRGEFDTFRPNIIWREAHEVISGKLEILECLKAGHSQRGESFGHLSSL